MLDYLLINIAISSIVLVIIKYGYCTNFLNYRLTQFGIFIWLIPYSYLAKLTPIKLFDSAIITEPVFSAISGSSNTMIVNTFDYNEFLYFTVLVSFIIGSVLFLAQIFSAHKWYKKLVNDPSFKFEEKLSEKFNLPIYSTSHISTGLLAGYGKPKIVISNSKQIFSQMELIITHEKNHLTYHDNYKLLVLNLISYLFWWNPIVRMLVGKSKFYIEALCDERASREYGEIEYAEEFAKLILMSNKRVKSDLFSSIMTNQNSNISRLKLLKENRPMTLKKKLSVSLFILISLTTMISNTFAVAINEQFLEKEQVLLYFDIKFVDRSNSDTTKISATQPSILVNFNEQAEIGIKNKFKFNFSISDINDAAFIEMKIFEQTNDKYAVIANPKLTTAYEQQAKIEIDNPNVSKNAFSITFTPKRVMKQEANIPN